MHFFINQVALHVLRVHLYVLLRLEICLYPWLGVQEIRFCGALGLVRATYFWTVIFAFGLAWIPVRA